MRRLKITILLCITLAAAQGATASSLDIDTTYASQGLSTMAFALQPALLGASAKQSDGKIVTTFTEGLFQAEPGVNGLEQGSPQPHRLWVRRFNADGSIDTAFGDRGSTAFTVRGSDLIRAMAFQADGKIVLAVAAHEACFAYTDVCITPDGRLSILSSALVRLTAEGALDTSFAGTGIVETRDFYGAYGVAVQPDGKLLLLGSGSYARGQIFEWYLARFNPDGTRDSSFNDGRSVESRCPTDGYSLIVQQSGTIVVAGSALGSYVSSAGNPGFCVERVRPDGSHDDAPIAVTPFAVNVTLRRMIELPDGKLLAIGLGSESTSVVFGTGIVAARYGADGSLDTTYGVAGKLGIRVADRFQLVDVSLERDGGFVALGQASDTSHSWPVWLRVTESGRIDTGFDSNGLAQGDPTPARLVGFLRDREERWLVVEETSLANRLVGSTIARYLGDRTDRLDVIEFYNTLRDHYFITADPMEANLIDHGSAGPDWVRTGATFKAGGAQYACRFYGSESPGPNSHFFTVSPDECGFLRMLEATRPSTVQRWNFEGLAFMITPVSADGTCPPGTVPIYRAYNNGFALGLDSNHRYSASRAVIEQMVARGWSDEGARMCAPE